MSNDWCVIQQGRVAISPEEAMARESAGEQRLTTAERWIGLDTSLVRSGDRLEENKGAWAHLREKQSAEQAVSRGGFVPPSVPYAQGGLLREAAREKRK